MQTDLAPDTMYHWIVRSFTEGALSAAASGSQATLPTGTVVTTGSGDWSSTLPDAPWPGGVPPGPTDDVAITDGHTVTIDTAAACFDLTIGQGSSGVLEFEETTARTLAVGGDVVIAAGGTFRTPPAGMQTGHMLSIEGSLANDGTLDFSTNADSAGAGITFAGDADASVFGSGPVTDLRALTLAVGAGTVLSLEPSNLSIRGATVSTPPFLTLTSGTLRIGGSYAMSGPLFATPAYTIGAGAGLWLDNPSFVVTPQSGSPLVSGLLRVSAGTLQVGTLLNSSLRLGSGSTVLIEGGSVEVASRLGVSSSANTVTYVQSGGSVVVNTVGNSSTTVASFDLGTGVASSATWSAGTVTLQNVSTGAPGPRDFRNRAGVQNITGGTLRLGNASTAAPATFYLQGTTPGLVITGTWQPHTARLLFNTTVIGTTVIDAGTTLDLNGVRLTQSAGGIVNDGTLTGTGGASEIYFLGAPEGGKPQTYSGAGIVTTPLRGAGLTVDNPIGVILDPGLSTNIVTGQVNLVRGTLYNSGKITLGHPDSLSTALTRIGAAGLATAGGSYDTHPVFNPGSAGVAVQYLQEGTARSTGYEVPPARVLGQLTINNPAGVVLAGGALTVTGSLSLTSGQLQTSSTNVLTLASTITSPPAGSAASHVAGPLAITVLSSSGTNRTFAVGAEGAYRPVVLKSVNTGGIARTFTAEVVSGPTGGTPTAPLVSLANTRYWRISNSVQLNATARVNLTFGADDNVGTLADLRVAQASAAAGSYANLGGTTTGTPSSGTVESTVNLTPGSDFVALGSVGSLSATWDGGAGTSLW
ncbi:MAG: beta strand repeat-containing protein, partial [bacterium]